MSPASDERYCFPETDLADCGKGPEMTRTEQKRLERVATTPRQARQIEDRNLRLLFGLWDGLEALHRGQRPPKPWRRDSSASYTIMVAIGCPHCILCPGCHKCAWATSAARPNMACLRAPFNGVAARDVALPPNPLTQRLSLIYEVTYAAIMGLTPDWDRKRQDKIERILVGHVDWARWVLTGRWDRGSYRQFKTQLRKEWRK